MCGIPQQNATQIWADRDGGAMGSRTPDLLIANETLYQLSYDPIPNPRPLLCRTSAPRQAVLTPFELSIHASSIEVMSKSIRCHEPAASV